MVGLQGSGKTTTSAKLGLMLQTKEKKRVLMASLDVQPSRRHGAIAKSWANRRASPRFPSWPARMPLDIAKRAMASAKVGGYDVLILDTAGRQSHRRSS